MNKDELSNVLRDAKIRVAIEKAESGDIDAIREVGSYYYSNRDYDKAVQYYSKGASKGDGKCALNLGVCYQLGLGVREDLWAARRYMQQAVNDGCDMAQTFLESIDMKIRNS